MGLFLGESVRPLVIFAQSDMEAALFYFLMCLGPLGLPYFSPQGALSLVKVDW